MVDIASISTAIATVKNAIEIADAMRSADHLFEKAELKLKISEIVDTLVAAKKELNNVQELILSKDKEIERLRDALEAKFTLARVGDAYYEVNSSGKPTGAPFCSACWQKNHQAIYINDDGFGIMMICPICGGMYNSDTTRTLA